MVQEVLFREQFFGYFGFVGDFVGMAFFVGSNARWQIK